MADELLMVPQRPAGRDRLSLRRRLLRSVGLFLITPCVTFMLGMAYWQRTLIYQPTRTPRLLASEVKVDGSRVEDVEVRTRDGLLLHGWWFRPATELAENSDRAVVIYLHGNGGCRQYRVDECLKWVRLGCEVLLFDYRGYGDNPGQPTEALLVSDAHQIWDDALRDQKLAPRQVYLYGESLGGGVATRLAVDLSNSGTPPGGLIMNSTFSSLTDTAQWHFPYLPVRWLLVDRFESIRSIPQLTCPLIQFHGTADTIVPFELGRKLFEAAPETSQDGRRKEFLSIPEGEHNRVSIDDIRPALQRLFARKPQ